MEQAFHTMYHWQAWAFLLLTSLAQAGLPYMLSPAMLPHVRRAYTVAVLCAYVIVRVHGMAWENQAVAPWPTPTVWTP